MDITKIKRTRRVEVTVGDESFWVEYVPRRWDNTFVEQHNAILAEEPEDTTDIAPARQRFIFTILAVADAWDITQDEVQLPITDETLTSIDDLYLYSIYKSIREDIEERAKEKN
jgi:hypothetical protein